MSKYRIEWTYKNGRTHWTYANSEDMALCKAKPHIDDPKVTGVLLLKVEEKRLLKDCFDYMLQNGEMTQEEYNNWKK